MCSVVEVENGGGGRDRDCVNLTSRSRICLMCSAMTSVARPRVSSAEQVPHTRIESETVIEEKFKFGKKLGQGSFGVVIEAVNNETSKAWAIKKVNKDKAGGPAVRLLEREVYILKRVKHDFIIHLEEVYETPRKMYLVMELCELGELKLLLQESGPFNELSTHHIICSLCSAITYLHRQGIVHRDLKLENILVTKVNESSEKDSPLYDIRLTDFGLSVIKDGHGSDSMLQSICGTPVYMAPEVIKNHQYSQTCDVWSIGVIMYVLLSNDFPWMADKEDRLYELIKQAKLNFDKPVWKEVSDPAKYLIGRMLTVNPAQRISASEIFENDSWIKQEAEPTAIPTVLEMMKQYNKEEQNSDGENSETLSTNLFDRADSASGLSGSSDPDSSVHGLSVPKKSAKPAAVNSNTLSPEKPSASARRASMPNIKNKKVNSAKSRALSGGNVIDTSANSSPCGTPESGSSSRYSARKPSKPRGNTTTATEHRIYVHNSNNHSNGLLKVNSRENLQVKPRNNKNSTTYPKSPLTTRRQSSPIQNHRNSSSANKNKTKKNVHH